MNGAENMYSSLFLRVRSEMWLKKEGGGCGANPPNQTETYFSLKSADMTEPAAGADLLSIKVPFLCNHFSQHTEGASLSRMIDIREC